jgi:hypothetical protein
MADLDLIIESAEASTTVPITLILTWQPQP